MAILGKSISCLVLDCLVLDIMLPTFDLFLELNTKLLEKCRNIMKTMDWMVSSHPEHA